MKRKMTHTGFRALGLVLLLAPVACSKKDEPKSAAEARAAGAKLSGPQPYSVTGPMVAPAPNAGAPSMEPEKTWETPEDEDERASPGVRNMRPEELGTEGREAKAKFKTVKGSKLTGEAKFSEIAGGVLIKVEVDNAPAGMKGLHIHEKGDCSDIAGMSMGSHFAPVTKTHGLPEKGPKRHLGDLGNLDIAQDGEGELTITISGANLEEGDPMSFLGRAIVIHEGKDVGAQPTGGAGKPMACGVIKPED